MCPKTLGAKQDQGSQQKEREYKGGKKKKRVKGAKVIGMTCWRSDHLVHGLNRIRQPTKSKRAWLGGKCRKKLNKQRWGGGWSLNIPAFEAASRRFLSYMQTG